MIGAIIGDVVGSRFEFNNHRSKDFNLIDDSCVFTDDTVWTIAVADWVNRISHRLWQPTWLLFYIHILP